MSGYGCNLSVTAPGALLGGVSHEEDISPSMHMLQELKKITSLPRLAKHRQQGEEEVEPSSELTSWMSATLASLPSKRRSTLPPLEDSKQFTSDAASQQGSEGSEASLQRECAEAKPSTEQPGQLPRATEVLDRLRSGTKGLLQSELSRMQSVFKRFRSPYSDELNKDDLGAVVQLLGYKMIDEATIEEVWREVTNLSRLDFTEFVSFVEELDLRERKQFRETFRSFNKSTDGELSIIELRKFMVAVGFVPLWAMLQEALHAVGAARADGLVLTEALYVLEIWRHTHGFTTKELEHLQSLFAKMAPGGANELPAEQAARYLRGFFGANYTRLARAIGAEIRSAAAQEAKGEQTDVPNVTLSEMLLWARRLREREIELYRERFCLYDGDGSESIDLSELQTVIAGLGYTLTKATIEEAMKEAQDEHAGKEEGVLDFEEFVNVSLIICSRDGFSKAEAKELREIFDRFDVNHNEEVEALELCDVLRYMGYRIQIDDVQLLIAKADVDATGSLDFREFQWLMRLHREEELQKIRKVFAAYEERTRSGIPFLRLTEALDDLGYQYFERQLSSFIQIPPWPIDAVVDFDMFVDAIDKCRTMQVVQERRCAGFSDSELEHFKELFAQCDPDGSDYIDLVATGLLIGELGFTIKTPQDQERFLKSLEKARANARAVGVENAGNASNPVSFWVLVQLLRVLSSDDDQHALHREAVAISETTFGQMEVDEFRKVFVGCVLQNRALEDESSQGQDAILWRNRGDASGDDLVTKELSKESVKRLLRSLGMSLNLEQRQQLYCKIEELSSSGRVDFADFLRLISWMLETNFADIHGSAAKVVRTVVHPKASA
mmetsp:Transcript_62123/g.172159  ORF Transcript_62123/g.172159 Transcript_62123/m.172159 type:complete len:840 (-) Transcript_62123:153-2672(-)